MLSMSSSLAVGSVVLDSETEVLLLRDEKGLILFRERAYKVGFYATFLPLHGLNPRQTNRWTRYGVHAAAKGVGS